MIRRTLLALMMLGLLALAALEPALARRDSQPVNLLEAMATGRVDAVFYGNGDQSVRGRIRRSAFGPEQVYLEPGTQFLAQQEGLQGMTTLGWVPIDLSRHAFAYVTIPAACTDYNLPAPTCYDRMSPVGCPDPRMAALSEHIGRVRPERPVSQIAVWAIANNPAWEDVVGYVEGHAIAETDEQRAEIVAGCRRRAAELLQGAGISPAGFRMFREIVRHDAGAE